MDEALDLAEYLPVSYKTPSEREYISFLWESFQLNYDAGKYQFAFLAYHLLMMSFVYFNIWQIKQTRPDDFEKGVIGFPREERELLQATSPFTFSILNESSVLRLLKLIGCDNSDIGEYLALVRDRNDAAHSNGNIFSGTQPEIDAKIRQVLRAVEGIQHHSQPVINRCYEEFLLQSHDADAREYLDAEDQIREVLIHGNFLSQKDIELCVNFDISALGEDNREAIQALHNTLCESYGSV